MRGSGKQPRKGAKARSRDGDGSPSRPGLPPQSSILAELSIDSPRGNRYRILRTSEKDATDDEKDENTPR
jgi:hypothetical protein